MITDEEKRELKQVFGAVCDWRIDTKVYPELEKEEEYQKAEEIVGNLYAKIEHSLGKKYKLINRFDAAKNAADSVWTLPVYLQGVKDCVLLLRFLGLIS